MKGRRKFDGEYFTYHSRAMTENAANWRAGIERNRGKKARVVKVKAEDTPGRYYWAIYTRG